VIEPFDVPYMQRALLVGLLVAVPCGLLGVWVVLRGLAFFAHAVGVATFPGVVVGLGVPALGPVAGSLLAAGAFSAGVSAVETDHRVRGGAITGLALATAMATGAVLLASVFRVSTPVETVLFGSLLGISDADAVRCAAVAVLTVAALAALGPRLASGTFDPVWTRATGVRPSRADAALLVLLALTAVVALPAVGSLLVSGLLVIPAATARLITGRLVPMSAWAVGLCAAELVAGLAAARLLDVAPGAGVATGAGAVFLAVAVGTAVRDRLRSRRAA